ncbi:MAG: RnfH family protein [Lysobacter sp.]|nr:RnfH family protein [Lysobacter sp.]
MKVQVVRAWPRRHEAVEVALSAGACVRDAVQAAGWAGDPEVAGFAIFGMRATPEALLAEGDRVELLRALTIDPMTARRKRAEARPLKKR